MASPRALPLPLRLALRELRGGLAGFRVFLACLAVGVASVAAVGSLSRALVSGLDADATRLLGGDVELRLTHRSADPGEDARLAAAGKLSRIVEMRAMARNEDKRTLVELKGVDRAYPLFGEIRLAPAGNLDKALAKRNGRWGAVTEKGLAHRLGVGLGDEVRVGEEVYRLTAILEHEPDRGADAFVLGPRLMVAADSLATTGLVREGSLVRYKYRIDLPPGTDVATWSTEIEQAFPRAGWRVRDVRNGAPGIRRFVERMRFFLILVGLSALLIGGIGIAGAVASHLKGRARTIAILKCLGAPDRLVFQTYFTQVALLSAVGIAIGLAIGAAAPLAISGLIAAYLPFEAKLAIYPTSPPGGDLWCRDRAGLRAPAPIDDPRGLRRGPHPQRERPRRNADPLARRRPLGPRLRRSRRTCRADPERVALRPAVRRRRQWRPARLLAARAVIWIGRRLPRIRRPGPRLAVANLHRPGAPTVNVVLSLGLGLTVMVTVGLLEGNLTAQVSDRLPEEAPAFFFIDIQPDQIEPFLTAARGVDGIGRVESVPSVRGRIIALKGRPAAEASVDPSVEWVIRGDRGLTYAAMPPPEAEIVAGEWWPADYAGAPLSRSARARPAASASPSATA